MENKQFDPGAHMRNLSGKDYLEVKWRLVWLREQVPDADIQTELVEHVAGDRAVFMARIMTKDRGSSTGWGSETYGDFRDYLEKAETKALGRALAALGFGTQFSDDYEDGAASGRPVDSPVEGGRTSGGGFDNSSHRGGGTWKPSPAQVKFALGIRDQMNLYEAYPDQKIVEMDGPAIRKFIDEYKPKLPPRER